MEMRAICGYLWVCHECGSQVYSPEWESREDRPVDSPDCNTHALPDATWKANSRRHCKKLKPQGS